MAWSFIDTPRNMKSTIKTRNISQTSKFMILIVALLCASFNKWIFTFYITYISGNFIDYVSSSEEAARTIVMLFYFGKGVQSSLECQPLESPE